MHQLYGIPVDPPEPLDREIVRLLLSDFEQRPWTVAEVTRHIDAAPALTLKALIRLRRAELISATDSYLLLAKPALYYSRIAGFTDHPSRLPLGGCS
jgi:hypothetical protein